MAFTPKRLFQSQIGTSETTKYTVPASTSCIIREVLVANTTASAANFEMSFVDSGGTAGDSNRVVPTVSIPAKTVVSFTYYEVLATGGFISTKAGTATALTVTASGVEIT